MTLLRPLSLALLAALSLYFMAKGPGVRAERVLSDGTTYRGIIR